ncbi:MAG: response regulator [Nitrospirae bacterium]|nr:response regulator [Nitrospirota bacterium]
MKVLIVEDNPDTREIWSTIFTVSGYEVVLAENGLEGVEAAQAQHPDVIVMDYSLPLLDGWQATRRIRSQPALRMVPIIGVTAHGRVADRQSALEAGCNDYLTKPCEPRDILAAVARALGSAERS